MNHNNKIKNIKYWIPLLLVILYILFILSMHLSGRYGFISKTVIIPFLFLAALLSKRGVQFIKDWSIFLSLVILFDYIRGLIYALITRFELPVYMNYVLNLELLIGRNKIFPAILQDIRQRLPISYVLDRIFIIVHSSHFFVFLLIGLFIWILRYDGFKKYTLSILMLMYIGALFYFIVPTVPPWMAANIFEVIPHVNHISASIYNTAIPSLRKAFDINPIAAMPSLHAAFPTLTSLITIHHFRKNSWPMVLYAVLVFVALIYLGEHYLTDVLAGILLGLTTFIFVYKLPSMKLYNHKYLNKLKKIFSRRKCFECHNLVNRLLLSMLIIFMSESIGFLTISIKRPFVVGPDFIESELKSKSPVVNEFLFNYAYNRTPFKMEIKNTNLLIKNGNNLKDLSIVENLVKDHPDNPEPLFWLTYFKYNLGIINQQRVFAVIDSLTLLPDRKKVELYKNLLRLSVQILNQ